MHAYVDALEKLQVRLDGVESEGHVEIRDRRKQIINTIERELQRVEQWKSDSIQSWQAAQVPSQDKSRLEDLSKESEDDGPVW